MEWRCEKNRQQAKQRRVTGWFDRCNKSIKNDFQRDLGRGRGNYGRFKTYLKDKHRQTEDVGQLSSSFRDSGGILTIAQINGKMIAESLNWTFELTDEESVSLILRWTWSLALSILIDELSFSLENTWHKSWTTWAENIKLNFKLRSYTLLVSMY